MWNSLRRRLNIFLTVLAVVPLLIVGIVLGWRSFADERAETFSLQQRMAQRIAIEIESLILARENELHVLTSVHNMQQMSRSEQQDILINLLADQNAYKTLRLLDKKGRETIRVSPGGVAPPDKLEDRATSAEYTYVLKTGKTYFGPVVCTANLACEPLMTIAVPVLDVRTGEIGGVLAADFRFTTIWQLISTTHSHDNETVFVTDGKGRVVAHKDPLVVLRETCVTLPEQNGIYPGLSGGNVVQVLDRIQLGNQTLVVVVEKPVFTAFSLALQTVGFILLVVIGAVLGAGTMGIITAKQIVHPIEALADTAQAIKAGHLSRRAEVTGPTEIAALAEAFNSMTAQLAQSLAQVEHTVLELELSQEALQESEQKYRILFEDATDAILVSDPLTRRLIDVNQNATDSLGYSRAELLQMTIDNVSAGTADDETTSLIQQMEVGAHVVFNHSLKRKDGASVPVEISSRLIDLGGRKVIQSFVRDITERIKAEEKIRRANRLYAVLSQVNQAIVRVDNKEVLFRDICQIFIEFGGFELAWIGRINAATQALEPLVFAGNEAGYLKAVRISTLKMHATGLGPSGMAVRQGKCIAMNDIAHNPRFQPWREEALKRGYRSSAAVPISANDGVIGVLNLYSADPHFFNEDEIKLLEEVGSDISFALDTLAQEAQRKQIEAAQAAVYRISEVANTVKNLDDLFPQIHAIVGELMPTHNFYIALYDEVTDMLSFPYFIDEHDPQPPPHRPSKGLTEYVLRTGESLLAASGVLQKLVEEEALEPGGTSVLDWVGVPLRMHGKILGVLSVQSYTESNRYGEREKALLQFVSAQIAMAIDRVRADEEKRKYRLLLENSNDFIAIASLDGQALFVNKGGRRLVGLDENEDVRAKALTDFLTEEGLKTAQTIEVPTVKEKGFWSGESTLRHFKTGQAIPVDVHSFLIRDPQNNRPIALATAQRDITARRQAEAELRRRNRDLTLLNRVIAASVASLEPETILSHVCKELSLAFEVPQTLAFLLNERKTVAEVVAEYVVDDRSSILNGKIAVRNVVAIRELFAQKKPLVVDDARHDPRLLRLHKVLRLRGTASLLVVPLIIEKEVLGALILDTTAPRRFSAAEVDLAQRVADQVSVALTRLRLIQTHERLSTAIDQVAESVIVADAAGNIIYVNPFFEAVTGYTCAEVLGKNVNIVKSDKQDNAFYKELWDTITSGKVWHNRIINKKKDGTLFTEDTTISPVRDSRGKIANYVAVKRDITKELELENQYRQAQKMDAIGQLTGGIAHDFNNLLTAINGYAELLCRQPQLQSSHREMVENILKSGQRAADLTRQLLAFSRKQIIQPKILDLNDVVSDLGKMLRRIIGETIQLNMFLASGLAMIKVDPTQVEQVIVNLAVNARDAMPAGGQLTIETSNALLDESASTQHIELQPGRYVQLTVTDTGVGMDKETLAHIFEPFFTTKEVGKGTGLGLATVYGIVKQHDGDVWVYSEPGVGTTFKIFWPCIEETPMATQDTDNIVPLPLPGGTETILVVDDDEGVRTMAVVALREQGYTVLEAANGAEVLQMPQNRLENVSLLLTDVVMPEMNGKALADRLKQRQPQIKVLFISGYTEDTIAHHNVLDPNIWFLHKPFTFTKLLWKIREILDGNKEA